MSDIYKLSYVQPVVIDSLPLSNWTIINANTLSVSGDTVTQYGVGGWQEEMYISFSVPTSGSYTISYDYDIESGYVGDWAYYGFGLFLAPNNPDVYDHYQFYANSGNRIGVVLANPSTSIAGMKGKVTFTCTLTANTNYYLWYPGGALNDGVTYHLTFKNICVLNDPIKYKFNNILTYPGLNRCVSYESAPNGLTIDLNIQGTDCTSEFLTQTKYPGVWTGYKVFRLGDLYTKNTHYYNYIKNLSNLTSNFTMYYFFAMYYNNANKAWGKATYSVDSSNCVAQTLGWTRSGQDSQSPQYDKSRYRSVTVDVSKGGNIIWDFYYNNDAWYGNSIYYAIPEELVYDVINSK